MSHTPPAIADGSAPSYINHQRFSVIVGSWTVVKLGAGDPIPAWALDAAGFSSITRTEEELSIVCRDEAVPRDAALEPGWSLLKMHGPLQFAEVGVLASFTVPLASAGISLFAVSTFDTDYILVKTTTLDAACEALVAMGHELVGP
jgi:uncharacterized protein